MTRFEARAMPGGSGFGDLARPVTVPSPDGSRDASPRPISDLANGNGNTNGHGTVGEPRLHSLNEHEFDVIAVVDEEGRFIFVSASAERLFGYDITNVVGLDVFGLFDSDSVEPVRALFRDLVSRRRLSVSLEISTHRADGTPIEIDVVAANHLDDPIGGVVINIRDITDRKQLQQRVEDSELHQVTIIDSLADGVMMVDGSGTVIQVNESFEVMFEAPRVRVLGHRLADLVDAAVRNGLVVTDADGDTIEPLGLPMMSGLGGSRRSVGIVLGLHRSGRPPMWVKANSQALFGSDGSVTGAVSSFSDITDARLSAAVLRREERFLQVLLDTLDEGIVACDSEGRITVFNPSARRLHGLTDDIDPIGSIPSDQGLRRADGERMAQRENPLIRAMSGEQLREIELVLESQSGAKRKVSVNGQPLVDEEGQRLGAVVAMHDVTEQKLNEERLAELAMHDPLTGLANRILLAERLQEAIDALDREARTAIPPDGTGIMRGVAVYLLDLDEFKEINDGLGHDVGDDMLIAVARRLSAIVRPSDTVARLGGDEVVVVCDIESGEEEMLRIADRISAALARPYRIDGRTLTVLASVGGVFADNPDTDPSKLLSRADDAMYGVKWSRRRERRSMMD
jgi:diguanylate cyclase (GGDEF)-like protein/PAS domain S-box-containing protein